MPFKKVPPFYTVWQGMKQRCYNPNFRQYHRYGGRGITVCDRWINSFSDFVEDMGERPPGYTLDRIDNNGNYSPENCRWASRKTQQRNRSNTITVVIDGQTHIAADLSEKAGLKTDTIIHRARTGMSFNDVVYKGKYVDKSGLALGGKANGERQKKKTHCPNGHEYSKKNTILSKQGWRRCRQCFYEKERRRRAKKSTKAVSRH